ncbi:MAG TPA: ABC transporter permease [Hyphomicrobiales bacterium]|nr:ABC transporter permease [Hyphomicrobiales bacterium]
MTAAAKRYLPLVLIVLAWEGVARLGIFNLLPAPSAVAASWLQLLAEGDLVANGLDSLYRLVAGLALAIVLGGASGVAMAWWRPVHFLVNPIAEMLYPLPKSALIPVTAIWLGYGDGSKILLIFLGCMLPVTIGAYNGVRGTDEVLVWSARAMGASRLRTLIDVAVPSALPELLNGVRVAIALSFVLLVSSELIVARAGLGYLIGLLGSSGVYPAMFAVVLTLAFLGFAADRLYVLAAQRMLRWRD